MSSGRISSLIAAPIAKRDCVVSPGVSILANTVACGAITPSQPPDQTIGIPAISSRLRVPFLPRARRYVWSARVRLKSLTPPFPSVFPIKATTWSAVNLPDLKQASRPDTSWGLANSNLTTSTAISKSPSFHLSLSGKSPIEPHYSTQHKQRRYRHCDYQSRDRKHGGRETVTRFRINSHRQGDGSSCGQKTSDGHFFEA